MSNHIFSVKNRTGTLKMHCQNKDTLEEIFECLVSRYLQGCRGINNLYDLKGIKTSTALHSGVSVGSIEVFLKKH